MLRDDFKRLLFAEVFYGRAEAVTPLTRLFQAEFPTVYGFICDQKRGGYEELARNMQRAESHFMIDTVCLRLMQNHAEIPVVTIHDSILTTEEHVPNVKRIMLEEFSRIDLRPSIEIGIPGNVINIVVASLDWQTWGPSGHIGKRPVFWRMYILITKGLSVVSKRRRGPLAFRPWELKKALRTPPGEPQSFLISSIWLSSPLACSKPADLSDEANGLGQSTGGCLRLFRRPVPRFAAAGFAFSGFSFFGCSLPHLGQTPALACIVAPHLGSIQVLLGSLASFSSPFLSTFLLGGSFCKDAPEKTGCQAAKCG